MNHPLIGQIERTGYPREMLEQPEHSGIDALGTEILSGDKIYEFGHETVLEDNLEEFLVEHLGVEIREAQ
ncbi:hypothetical protein [Virgibacillus sp. YIM 98842]|jgi:hypothetical protein|uniref:YqaI family protein n=1 Tax=Virgibacillus sp. YIM 98842 TaxID=2663533 RepID=UPI0013DA2A99|nr:hypothetical protein [Virgibacillus sp. YIM 98842]